MATTSLSPINEQKLQALLGRVLGDIGGAMNAPLLLLGDRLGLYKALARGGPMSPAELARATGTNERYVHEWLAAQAASGYAAYDAATGKFAMEPEQAAVLADEESPVFLAGVGELVAAAVRDEPRISAAFLSGRGVGWDEHDPCLFRGTARFFRTSYKHHLVQEWLPALEGVVEKLRRGATVADIGCGHGVSTLIMARAFPQSRFYGFDYHASSVEEARSAASAAGLSSQVDFQVATAKTMPARNYDLVCFFDCLHDMGDPVGALRHVRETLAADGTCMLVEPFANDRLEDNLNPVGRIYFAASTMICTPAAMKQEGAMALGAQAGEARLRQVAMEAGFPRFRRAAETPFNIVYELRR